MSDEPRGFQAVVIRQKMESAFQSFPFFEDRQLKSASPTRAARIGHTDESDRVCGCTSADRLHCSERLNQIQIMSALLEFTQNLLPEPRFDF